MTRSCRALGPLLASSNENGSGAPARRRRAARCVRLRRSRCRRFGLERREVDLADPRQRQLRAELDLAWTRPLGETRAAVFDQLGSQSAVCDSGTQTSRSRTSKGCEPAPTPWPCMHSTSLPGTRSPPTANSRPFPPVDGGRSLLSCTPCTPVDCNRTRHRSQD
jgi:hypothetical protein